MSKIRVHALACPPLTTNCGLRARWDKISKGMSRSFTVSGSLIEAKRRGDIAIEKVDKRIAEYRKRTGTRRKWDSLLMFM